MKIKMYFPLICFKHHEQVFYIMNAHDATPKTHKNNP